MSKVIVIHPPDRTTEFLGGITKAFGQVEEIVLLEPGANYEALTLDKELSEIYQDGDIIFFLGHGRSDALYGALDDKGQRTILLTRDQVRGILANRNGVLFSCHSASLLKKIGSDVNKYVGFGNMPTDWDEIMAHRDIADFQYLSNLTDNSLGKFRSILVAIVVATRFSLTKSSNFSREVYLTLRLELNMAMLKMATDTELEFKERVELFKILQETKQEITYKD